MIGNPSDGKAAQVEDLMVNQFDMEPVDVQCMRDVRVVSLAKQMAGLKSSQSSFHVLMKCLPPEVRHSELEDTADVVFSGDMVGHTQTNCRCRLDTSRWSTCGRSMRW